jgi:hypothetical protein
MSSVSFKEEEESLVAPYVASLFAIFGSITFLLGSIPALLGFTASGIAAGSFAAAMQAAMGSVGAGSCFAVMQSMGATGFFNMAAGLGGVAAGAGFCTLPGGKEDSTTDEDLTNDRDDRDEEL